MPPLGAIAHSHSRLAITLFGRPRIRLANGAVLELPTRRGVREILAFMFLRRRSLGRREVALALWPEADEKEAQDRLRANLSHMRRYLGEVELLAPGALSWLTMTPAAIGGEPPADMRLDVAEFDSAFADPLLDGDGLDAAIRASWEPLLEGIDGDWVRDERRDYEDRHLVLVERRARRRAIAGNLEGALEDVDRLLDIDPAHELALRLGMWAEWRGGGAGAALRRLEGHLSALSAAAHHPETPSAETLDLAAAIRAGRQDIGMPGAEPNPDPTPPAAVPADGIVDRPAAYRRPLVDRQGRVAQLLRLAPALRLTTLVGPAGIGKSRIAAAAFRRLEATGPPPTWLDLAAGPHHSALLHALSRRLETSYAAAATPADDATRERILILDNADAALDACAAWVLDSLRHDADLHIIVSSRSALGIESERLLRLPGLDRAEAIALFQDRFGGGDGPGDEAIARMAAELDGLPAAVEWAALRARGEARGDDPIGVEADGSGRDRRAWLEGRHKGLPELVRSALVDRSASARRLLEYLSSLDTAVSSRDLPRQDPLSADPASDVDPVDAFEELVEHSLLLPLPASSDARRYRVPAIFRGQLRMGPADP
jgi:DNA-binding SARP family transcriptional activator